MSEELDRRNGESRKVNGTMLLPAKAEVARQLRRYRAWERMMLATPTDRAVRATFEDSGYTLCVLMGKRCAREAADAAERYLRTNLVTYLQEQNERPRKGGAARRGPPSPDRCSPAGRQTPSGAA
jgi:hypothetical protein